jgi:ATP-binding cassette subfamily B protein
VSPHGGHGGAGSASPGSPDAFDADLSGRLLDAGLLRRLLGWLAPERGRYLLSGVLVLIQAVASVMLPVLLSIVVIDHVLMGETTSRVPDFGLVALTDRLAAASGTSVLFAACVLYACVQLLVAVAGHFHRVTLADAVVRGLSRLRRDVFTHLLSQPAAFWDRVSVGRVTTRVTNDVEALYELLRSFGALAGELVPFFVALSIMLTADAWLTLVMLAFAPLLGASILLYRRLTRTLYRDARQSVSLLNQNMQENLAGLTVVQLHGRESENLDRYTRINERNRSSETRANVVDNIAGAFNSALADIAVAAVLWFGGLSALDETITLGTVVLFTRYIDMLFQPIVALGDNYNLLFRSMASGERIFQALDWNEPVHRPEHPVELPEHLAGELAVDGLTFAYATGPAVLRDVALDVPAGTRLAIVGPTGSGKSTFVRLLARLYEPPRGTIRLDGIDVLDVDPTALRHRIGFVLQDFHVFAGSILDNITLGDPEISRERAIEAARAVGAAGFVDALPQGFDTPLAERGRNLSQGQRQLLAFARVLATDPSLLILDEATANVDPETEALIQRALDRITAGRTSIIIAHRLATVRDADRVLVLVNGEVEAIGPPDELLEHSPTFARLHAMQFREL